MFRSTIRRLRRTLSFRSRSKHRGRNKSAGGGGNQNWEGDSVSIKSAGGCSFPAKVWKLRLQNALSEPSYVFRTILSLSLSLSLQSFPYNPASEILIHHTACSFNKLYKLAR